MSYPLNLVVFLNGAYAILFTAMGFTFHGEAKTAAFVLAAINLAPVIMSIIYLIDPKF